eukprot:1212416-Rhodomonas_salina.1
MAPQHSRQLSAWELMEEWEGLFGREEDEAELASERQELHEIRDAIFHSRMEHNLKYPDSNKLPVFPDSNIDFRYKLLKFEAWHRCVSHKFFRQFYSVLKSAFAHLVNLLVPQLEKTHVCSQMHSPGEQVRQAKSRLREVIDAMLATDALQIKFPSLDYAASLRTSKQDWNKVSSETVWVCWMASSSIWRAEYHS